VRGLAPGRGGAEHQLGIDPALALELGQLGRRQISMPPGDRVSRPSAVEREGDLELLRSDVHAHAVGQLQGAGQPTSV
jgi:hypothetical protein